jgi:hypothetical protein
MFSCDDFRLLDENLQAQILWVDGVSLMARKTEKANIELFSLYDFYVEVFFENDDEPLFMKAFKETIFLDTYLKMINIDSIYETIKGNR